MRKIISPLWFILMVVMLASCSSLRKAELAAGNDPKKAVAEVTQIMQAAQQDQIDVLADKQFSKGSAFLADANHGLKQGESSDLILGNAAIAKAFFEDARVTAKSRQALASRILTARESALSAGVRKSDALVQRMMEIDNDLKSETKQFSRSLDPEDFSEFQKKYLALEVMAVQFRELSGAKQAIEQAKDKDARNVAPETLQAASLDYEAAMNMIAQSPRSPNLYKKSVDDALASATLLVDVMNVITGAKGTPEKIAIQIVKQKRALGELSTSVGKLEANLQSTQQSLQEKEEVYRLIFQEKEGVLKTQEAQLARASTQVRFQQAMDEAQKELSPDDALVYQQGNNLVFRLKRINFQSGTAVIPEFSKLLLSKVDAIIKKLDAEKVVVEGHTDSVGSTEVNQRLSTERATAVANYLFALRGGYKIQYVGYGESQPIASNETAAGRATNRRVDLVVSVKQ